MRSAIAARRVCLFSTCQYRALGCTPRAPATRLIDRSGSPISSSSPSAVSTMESRLCPDPRMDLIILEQRSMNTVQEGVLMRDNWEARDIARVAVFAALIVVLGFIGPILVPGLVPITAQTLGVMLAGGVRGAKRGGGVGIVSFALVCIGVLGSWCSAG